MKYLFLIFISAFSFTAKAQQNSDTLFYEPFDDNHALWTVTQSPTTQMQIKDGKLKISYTVKKKSYYSLYTFKPDIESDTFSLKVLLLPDSMKYGGIIYKCSRKDDNSMEYYSAYVREKNFYCTYSYYYNTKSFQWIKSNRSKNDMKAPILFEIRASGRKLDFYANGIFQFSETLGKDVKLREFGWVSAGPSSFAIDEILITK